jgi:hypothetical protein
MALQFLDDVNIRGGVTVSGSFSAANINTNANYVESPRTVVGAVSGISQILVMNQTTYDTLTPKLSTTLYIIV